MRARVQPIPGESPALVEAQQQVTAVVLVDLKPMDLELQRIRRVLARHFTVTDEEAP